MPNTSFPNPAQQSDVIAALLQTLAGQPVNPFSVGLTVFGGASTTYGYTVVAKFNGQSLPIAATTTAGPATLGAANYITIAWSPVLPPTSVQPSSIVYDVYRTTGGTTQGKIASNISLVNPMGNIVTPSVIDNGIAADGTTAPAFNTVGVVASGQVDASGTVGVAGALTQATGKIFITAASALALTLATPPSGPFANGGLDGAELVIYSTTAFAHTVTLPSNILFPSHHLLTFAAAAGNYVTLYAQGGLWYVGPLSGVTPS